MTTPTTNHASPDPYWPHIARYKPFGGEQCWAVFPERGGQPVECRSLAEAKRWASERFGVTRWVPNRWRMRITGYWPEATP